MNTKLSVIALVLLFAAPILPDAAVLDVPGAYPTIQTGIDTAAEGDTVLVAPGTYYELIDIIDKSITLASHYITTGDTMYMHETVIDGNKWGCVVTIGSKDMRITPTITGLTIQNAGNNLDMHDGSGISCYDADPILDHLIIRNNSAGSMDYGGGCDIKNSNPVFDTVVITGNKAVDGGGIYFLNSSPVIKNTVITDNYAHNGGGIYCSQCETVKCENVVVRGNSDEGIYSVYSNLAVNNSEITNNDTYELDLNASNFISVNSTIANYSENSVSCVMMYDSVLTVVNSIVWNNNSSKQIEINNTGKKNYIYILHSFFRDGISGIKGKYENSDINTDIDFSASNIMDDPLFIDPDKSDFRLLENSPCIDAGTAYLEWNGEVLVDLARSDYSGLAPDIGAYESGEPNKVAKEDTLQPSVMHLSPYPNPFNAEVTIPYRIETDSVITLAIYNCMGQKVAELLEGFHAPGLYTAVWNAEGCASGVYYCVLNSDNLYLTGKMLYIK